MPIAYQLPSELRYCGIHHTRQGEEAISERLGVCQQQWLTHVAVVFTISMMGLLNMNNIVVNGGNGLWLTKS
jgi:hypothetical protein